MAEMTIEQQRAVAVASARMRMAEQQPAELDKYQQAAAEDRAALQEKGLDTDAELARLGVHGATFNASDEILAGLKTPLEMVRRGTLDPREGYKYAKAQEDLALSEGRKKAGWAAPVAEIGGGVLSGSGLARGGLSVFNALRPNAGLVARTGASAADAAGYGAVAGALEGNTLDERGKNALHGAAIGGGIGAAAPAVVKVAGALISPLTSNIRARMNPTRVGEEQFARGLSESGRTSQQVADDVAAAAREGQDVFTVADAMGHPGQRMLSGVTRSPGQGRTDAVEFLEQRQAGQGRRVSNALAEGFDAPQTAAQTEARLTAQRGSEANVNYGQARADAGAVNVTPAIEAIDTTLQPGVTRIMQPQTNIADNSVEGALRRARRYLTDGRSQVTDFDGALLAKREIDAMIETASPTVQRSLIPVRNALDDQLAASSQSYRNARDTFRRQSQAIEAVDTGRTASMRGRTEDTVPAFRGMPADQQAAFRTGYVDPLIAQTQGAAVGVNKARPFTSDAFQTEAAAVAPMQAGPIMQRRLGRENTMFDTRRQAIGGSQTADNLADQEALRETPSLIARLGTSGLTGGLRHVISLGSNVLSGSTPQVRAEIARLLLQRGGNANVRQILNDVVKRQEIARALRDQFSSGTLAGTALVPTQNQRR